MLMPRYLGRGLTRASGEAAGVDGGFALAECVGNELKQLAAWLGCAHAGGRLSLGSRKATAWYVRGPAFVFTQT